jgi:hypothetical protein
LQLLQAQIAYEKRLLSHGLMVGKEVPQGADVKQQAARNLIGIVSCDQSLHLDEHEIHDVELNLICLF